MSEPNLDWPGMVAAGLTLLASGGLIGQLTRDVVGKVLNRGRDTAQATESLSGAVSEVTTAFREMTSELRAVRTENAELRTSNETLAASNRDLSEKVDDLAVRVTTLTSHVADWGRWADAVEQGSPHPPRPVLAAYRSFQPRVT